MKKMLSILLCVLLIGALALFASAEDSSVVLTPSATTLYRGDTFTIVATLNNSEEIALGTVVLSYDESVFELTGGTCHVSGANPAQVVVAQKVGTFFLNTATVVSGDIFTFNFTVKDDAALGTYTVTPTAAIGTTEGKTIASTGATVTVTEHRYGDWEKLDDSQHQRTCSECGDVEKAAHEWDEGSVIQPVTCEGAGETSYTCTVCGATKTETVNALGHKDGRVVETDRVEADCENPGSYVAVIYCANCEQELRTENRTIEALGHAYDHDCDTTCNNCGLERTTTHSFAEVLTAYADGHGHACTVCGYCEDKEDHVPGDAATETTDQTCTVCGYVLQEALGHTHTYEKTYTYNTQKHWKVCTGCGTKKSSEYHSYDHGCDPDCNVCGYVRETEHNYSNRLSSSAEGHWYACTFCGDVLEMYPHNPGAEATDTTDQICMDCGFIIVPAGNHTHNPTGDWLSDMESHWYNCACGEELNRETHVWDDGTADENAGLITYRCTVCGYPKVVELPPNTNPTNPNASDDPYDTTPSTQPQNGGQSGSDDQNSDGFPWRIFAIVVTILLIGFVGFVLIGILLSKRQKGKYI